jgi:hypothetical protein
MNRKHRLLLHPEFQKKGKKLPIMSIDLNDPEMLKKQTVSGMFLRILTKSILPHTQIGMVFDYPQPQITGWNP